MVGRTVALRGADLTKRAGPRDFRVLIAERGMGEGASGTAALNIRETGLKGLEIAMRFGQQGDKHGARLRVHETARQTSCERFIRRFQPDNLIRSAGSG
jgi:hypothetical protein